MQGGRHDAEVDAVLQMAAADLPDRGVAIVVAPQDVAHAVAVEVAAALDVPVAGDDAEVDRSLQMSAADLPDEGVAVVVAPEDVAGEIGVEVAGVLDVPVV